MAGAGVLAISNQFNVRNNYALVQICTACSMLGDCYLCYMGDICVPY